MLKKCFLSSVIDLLKPPAAPLTLGMSISKRNEVSVDGFGLSRFTSPPPPPPPPPAVVALLLPLPLRGCLSRQSLFLLMTSKVKTSL